VIQYPQESTTVALFVPLNIAQTSDTILALNNKYGEGTKVRLLII
jgi:hypothetical protein